MIRVTQSCRPAGRRQRGAAALITVLFLLIVVAFAVLVSLSMSGSDVSDSAYQHNSVQALFLADSALETATYNYTNGGCSNAGIGANVTPIGLGSGGFTRVSATVVGAYCQIRASGTVGNVTRTVDGSISMTGGGAITADISPLTPYANFSASPSISYTVPAGASILLVGLAINNANATVSVKYGSTTMSPGPSVASASPWPRAQIWYLVNPPAGTANIVATINPATEVVMGATWFSGVNTSTGASAPWDTAAATATGNGKTASVTITPVTSGAWVFEVVAIDANDTTTMGSLTNRTSRWKANSNGNVRGAASVIGPVSAAVTPTWSWTTGNNAKWSHAAVALRPGGGSPQLVRWTEVVN